MPVMSEEQFSHLEAMIKAVVKAHIAFHVAEGSYKNSPLTDAALSASDIEHNVRKAAKEALTK